MFDFKAFSYPKDPQSGCIEDAWRADKQKGLLVISDGASSSLFSGKWANLLCDGVIQDVPLPERPELFSPWLNGLRKAWAESIDYNSLQWFQRPKLSTGAFATLVWASVEQTREIPEDWTGPVTDDYPFFRVFGRTVGDACLFHFRGTKLLRSIPISASADFDSTPMLVGSANLGKDNTIVYAPFEFLAAAGDWILLATDAMAQWILYQMEKNEPPLWDKFWLMNETGYKQFIEAVRGARQIRIDDTTIIAACLGGEQFINREVAGNASSGSGSSGSGSSGSGSSGTGSSGTGSSGTGSSGTGSAAGSSSGSSSGSAVVSETSELAPIELSDTDLVEDSAAVSPSAAVGGQAVGVGGQAAGAISGASGAGSVHNRIIQQNDIPMMSPASLGTRTTIHPSENIVIQPPRETTLSGGTFSPGGLRPSAVYRGPGQMNQSTGGTFKTGAGSSGTGVPGSSSGNSAVADDSDDDEYELDLSGSSALPTGGPGPGTANPAQGNVPDNSATEAASGEAPASAYLSMHERAVQAQIDRELREKKEREDSFGFQLQQGMEEGLRDMKGFVNDGLKDVQNVVGEQAKEVYAKGKEKLGKLWGSWFNKDKGKENEKNKDKGDSAQ